MKYLTVIAIALGVYWFWRQGRLADKAERERTAQRPPMPRGATPPQDMVACEVCGLHLPRSDALADGPGGSAPFYCSPEHRRSRRG
ncbi:PP0621 family protein [Curvibacter sp. RS43]|uniref:PP0621 family protein n=1 Tax=Curvibacter microcysteis TaxID=3026419 RepID=A0ABT5MAQ2_9BURK|nr:MULTISPECIES: PP0621 family protein [unclassified Curvibacter]MDD0812070.1 PP0621 family protein [Curvibacter sp. RS43]MDD0813034.1 PP0621 family protein [Curvibacter sp. HBC28]